MKPNWKVMYPYYKSLPVHPDGDFFSCGIRLSMTLHHAGAFNKAGYRRRGFGVSRHGWAMMAEQLYQWLRTRELGESTQIAVSSADTSRLPTTNGIVYLRNCFLRSSDSGGRVTGDHIDLYVAGHGLLSAIRWPAEFPGGPFALLTSCGDGKIRFWPAT